MAQFEEVITGSFEMRHATIHSVKADFLKGNLAVTFTFSLTEEMLRLRKHLSMLAMDDDMSLDLHVVEKSMQLTLDLPRPAAEGGEG
jgi:hypothetical protein